jgi:sugar phosphate isomerase/epimerase
MKLGVYTAILHARPLADALDVIASLGLNAAEINAGGNPLHSNPVIGEKHAADLKRAIRAASALGQTRVVTMSGLPGGEPGSTVPNWIVNAWNSGALDVLEYQWDQVVVPFWREIEGWVAQMPARASREGSRKGRQ